MTFEEKIKNSEVLEEGYIEKGKEVKNLKSRLISLLLAVVLAAYTIYTNMKKYDVINNRVYEGNYQLDTVLLIVSFVALTIKVFFTVILAFLKKSIYAMNHYKTYRAIEILSSLVLIIIFSINMYNYITILDLKNNWDYALDFKDNLQKLSMYDKNSTFFFIVTIVINVPLLFKTIIFSFKNGGIFYLSFIIVFLFPIFLIKFINNTKDIFYEFKDSKEHKKYYLMKKRKMTIPHYIRDVKLEKFFSMVVVFVLILVPTRMATMAIEGYSWLVVFGIFGFVSNLVYFFDLRINLHLDSLSHKFINKTIEESEIKEDNLEQKG